MGDAFDVLGQCTVRGFHLLLEFQIFRLTGKQSFPRLVHNLLLLVNVSEHSVQLRLLQINTIQ